MRPCLVCGALGQESRCRAHRRPRGPQRAAYADPAYRAAREALRGSPCALCGLSGSDSVGHVIPLARGGTNHPMNLQPEHLRCPNGQTGNLRKGAR